MLIESVKVSDFGTIGGPVEIDLHEGLNVIHGPNESGKSTLMRAIWLSLTRKSTSNASEIRAIRPKTGGTPEIEVVFKVDDSIYELTKVFHKDKGKTYLRRRQPDGSIQEFSDDEAEEKLHQVMGFGATGRRKPKHYGLWPLTWVRQGEDYMNPAEKLQEDGRDDQLTQTLGELTGQALSGKTGQELVDAVYDEYDKFFTSTGQPTKKSGAPLYEATNELEEARQELRKLKRRRRDYQEDVKRYETVEDKLNNLQDEEIPNLQEKLRKAEEEKEQVENLQNRRKLIEANKKSAAGNVEKWQEILERRETLRKKIEKYETELDQKADTVDELEKDIVRRQNERPELARAREEADEKHKAAQRIRDGLQTQLDILRDQEKHDDLAELVEKGKEHRRELTETRGELRDISINDEAVDELEQLKRTLDKKEADLRAASARLQLKAIDDVELTVAGEQVRLEAGGEREETVDAPITVQLEDQLEVSVHPGKQDFVSLRQDAEAARKAYNECCDELGVDSLSNARQLNDRRKSLESDEKRLEQLLEQVAEEGIDTLEEELQAVTTRLEQDQQELEELVADDDVDRYEDEQSCRQALQEANEELEEAEDAFDAACQALNDHDKVLQQLQHELELAEERRQTVAGDLQEATDDLEASIEKHGEDERVQDRLDEAEAEVQKYEDDIAEIQDELSDLRAEDIELTVEQAEKALDNTKQELRETRDEFAGLKTRLKAADLQGLHGRIAKARDEVNEAELKTRQLERRAEATKLLCETLIEARQEIREAYHRPLRDAVAELLPLLFPESTVEFEEGFQIGRISREIRGEDDFDALSFGAREQLGIVVRLAMARLLAEQGAQPPVFLDDILASSDDDRFEAMIPIFGKVAGDIQLIITTCHYDRFRKCGADKVVDLQRYKRGAVGAE